MKKVKRKLEEIYGLNKLNMYSIDRINQAVELMLKGEYKESQKLLEDEPMIVGKPPITKTNPPTQEEMEELQLAIHKIVAFAVNKKMMENNKK